jgi:hypothetical protein
VLVGEEVVLGRKRRGRGLALDGVAVEPDAHPRVGELTGGAVRLPVRL